MRPDELKCKKAADSRRTIILRMIRITRARIIRKIETWETKKNEETMKNNAKRLCRLRTTNIICIRRNIIRARPTTNCNKNRTYKKTTMEMVD